MPAAPALWELTATELRQLYVARELSPVEVVACTLERIEQLNPELNAYVLVTGDLALSQAHAAEAAYAAGEDGSAGAPMLGIPASIKDNLATRGIRTTMGSLLLQEWVPDFDAAVAERFRNAGVALLGKTNTSEFGWKGDAGNLVFGQTRNPWRTDRTSGGSSGGAAAAVASGLCPIAIGTDGAGSLRIPAAFCGVVGYKPAQGTVPVYPNSGIGSLSHHGTIARTVRDIALVLDAIAGPDERDRLSVAAPRGFVSACDQPLTPLRVGFSPTLGYADVEPAVLAAVAEAVGAFDELGCHVEEIDPRFEDPHDAVWTIMQAAHATQHAHDLEDVRELIDPGRLAMVESGRSLTAIDLGGARLVRSKLYESMVKLFSTWDLMVTPTMPLTAFELGVDTPSVVAGKPTERLSWTPFTYPFNLTGHPAITLPCGVLDDGLPVGMQIVGPWRGDHVVLQAAAAFEAARPWPRLAPFARHEATDAA